MDTSNKNELARIELPPAALDTTAAAMFLAEQLSAAGRGDLAALLVKNELHARLAKKAKRRRKQVLYSPQGDKIELYQDVVERLEADE